MKLRGLVAALAVVVAMVAAPSAQAAFTSLYPGGSVTCTTEASRNNIRACSGFTLTWDHKTKIDVNVFLPAEPTGKDGPYPLIGDFHGWGGSKQGLTTVEPAKNLTFQQEDPRIQHWAEEGYAVFSMSDRGWGLSCGVADPIRKQEVKEKEEGKTPAVDSCAQGYNHLMDDRYEVRDAQYLMSELADEGVVEQNKIGATGASYGGGMSLALAALRNRTMEENGALVPWESPGGLKMEIAAAAPQWPWTDLSYALAPNGRNLDYVTDSSYKGPNGNFPVGVMKYSWAVYLYKVGEALSNYNTSKESVVNIPGYIQRLEAGEPYTDESILGIIKLLSTFHSAYGINSSVEPAPALIQSGWNDDLFPVDEALRFYQRTRAQYPDDPISLYLADIGHARSQNKPADVAAFNARLEAWFARYLKDEGPTPTSSVEALTTTCPKTTPSEGPFTASDWSGLAPGEIRLQSSASQTIEHGTFEEEKTPTFTAVTFDPIAGPEKLKSNLCSSVSAADAPRTANYRLGEAPAGGFTLMGSPTITAKVTTSSPNSEIAARLVDVAPGGTETLISRGLYRPAGGTSEIVFQLHPQAYHFAEGHVAKLELLPNDLPYGRFSNLQTNVTVSDLELRLPVREAPGALGGMVQTPAPKVVPPGYTLAAEYQTNSGGGGGGGGGGGTSTPSPKPTPAPAPVKIGAGGFAGKFSANRKAVIVPVKCTGEGACSGQVSISVKNPGGKGRKVLAKGSYSVGQGATAQARLPLTKAGRNIVKGLAKGGSRSIAGVVNLIDPGRPSLILKRPVHLSGGK